MSDAPQGISRSSSASSLDSFQLIDASAAAEVEMAAEDVQSSAGPQIVSLSNGSDDEESESESESDFEEIVPEADTASEFPPSALQVGDEVESQHASPSFTCQYFEFDDTEIDSCDSASVQLDEPEADPAVGSSTKARRRRSMAPVEVAQLADEIRQSASEGMAEAASLINNLDNRIDDACPHVCNGATYFKQQVQADIQSTAKALGEEQESVPQAAPTFSDFKDQFKTDYDAIRKDVDSALGCLLGSKTRKAAPPQECAWPSEHQQKTLKSAIPNAACSLVSVAVASWLLPSRLARFAAENIDSLAGLPSKDWRPEGANAW